MKNKGIRIIDLVVWICMLVLASLMLCAFLGCAGFNERVDRAITVAESAVDIANEARVASGEIRDQIEDNDWLGVTESILIGAGGVLAAFGSKKGYDKLKKESKS